MLLPLQDLLGRCFAGRKVSIDAGPGAFFTGEYRGIWKDAVPYFPNIECPAFWLTDWGETFVPVTKVSSIETT